MKSDVPVEDVQVDAAAVEVEMRQKEREYKLPEYVLGKCRCGRIRNLHLADKEKRLYLCRYCEKRPAQQRKRRRSALLPALERIRRDTGVGA